MSLVSFYSQSIFWSDRSAAFGCLSFGWALSIGRRMDIFVCCLPGFQKARSTSTVRPARWSWRPAIEILTVVKYDRLKHITLQGKRNLTKRSMATVSLWQVSYLAASRTSHDQLAQLVLHTIGHIEQTLTAGPEWSRYLYWVPSISPWTHYRFPSPCSIFGRTCMKRDEATAVLHADMCVHGPHTRTNVLHDMEDMKR